MNLTLNKEEIELILTLLSREKGVDYILLSAEEAIQYIQFIESVEKKLTRRKKECLQE